MQKRPFGTTGAELSVIGFGGVLVMDETPETAAAYVRQARARGVNYFDVAPSYGNAEERLGPALAPYRREVFLACKTLARTAAEARTELSRSLELLGTDHFDLYQFHAIGSLGDVEAIFAAGGAMEMVLAARDEGLVRWIGFSAHSEAAALAMLSRFDFTSVLFPLNWVTWHAGDMGKRLVEKAQERGTALLALKATARARLPEGAPRVRPKCWYVPAQSAEEAALGVRFTLSLPVIAAVPAGEWDLFTWACDAADRFTPLTPAEQSTLAARARGLEPLLASDVPSA